MPAMDALHAKTTFRDDLRNGSLRQFTIGFARSIMENERKQRLPMSEYERLADAMIEDLSRWTDASEAFYVHPRMTELVTAASESMPDEPLMPEDLPTQQGFVLIPGGLTMIDIRGSMLVCNAVLWSTFGGKVTVTMLSDKYDPKDTINIRHIKGHKALPRYTFVKVDDLEFGRSLPVTPGPDMVIPPEYGVQVEYGPEGEVAIVSDKGYSAEEMEEMFSFGARTDPTMRWLVTMWRLMQQPITSIEKEFPNRQQRRALERKNVPDKHVSVVTLRRKVGQHDSEAEVHWSHRWLVRGHWRRQPYKENGETVYRYIWIHPFVKGPEDAPLLVREHVYDLSR